jgi:cellulose synthase/poly-beta-1,6-N-acetylglucosamine synthase-like glycosyltransferase
MEYAYGQDLAKQGQSNFNVVFVSPGCASMYRTDVLSKLHIDENTLAEDMDLTIQVHRQKERVVYAPEARVITQDPDNLKDYFKQILRWYRGFWQVVLKHNTLRFTKKQWVDAYMLLLIIDATIFNRVIWLIGLSIIFPNRVFQILAVDVATMLIVQLYGAWRTKRIDLIKKFPQSYLIGFVSVVAYLRAFIEIYVLRRNILAWNKVKRYQFDSVKTA